uniref:Uncharacterized protein n=1 Tax=Hydropuntia rangiferina TaxID=338881 RepID=A0A345U8B2_9FLOR|nr:hypothetical protein [Hydropuntia rangiferina]AXI96698.1 hypothetical protein [Hydropuntia rangiferina]
MESLQYINSLQNELNLDDLVSETPIGWSSTCFDETINYYIDCNSNNSSYDKTKNQDNKINS